MRRSNSSAVVALALSTALVTSGCTAVAIGSVVVGSGSLIAASQMYEDDCDGEGCAYGNVAGVMLGLLGLVMVAGGAIYLAVDHQRE